MVPAPAALPRIDARRLRRSTASLLALLLAVAAAPGWAQAGSGIDCKAINRGALNVALDAAASDTRSVALRSGETVKFIFRAEPGPFGTLTLREGGGASRLLLAGPTGTSVSFAAARSGSFSFEFARDGEEAALFTASCVPARTARRKPKGSPGLRSDTAPLGDSGVLPEPLHLPEADTVVIDARPPTSFRESTAPLDGKAAISVPTQAGGPEMTLQWRGERYAGSGSQGPRIDRNASGIDIGVNYKLQSPIMIGALAQFDPAAEMLFGGQPSLSDHGWMAGPVTTVHFAPGLVLDARAAWGSAESGAADAMIGAGPAAQRRLLSARLAKAQSFGAWRFTPSVSFSHFEQMLHTPSPSSAEGQAPAEASAAAPHVAGSGRIDVAPAIAYRIDMESAAFIEPRAVLGGFWAFDDLAALSPGAGVLLEPRLKAEAGVTVGVVDGPKLQALGVVEEGDGATPDVWSGRVQLSVPLQ